MSKNFKQDLKGNINTDTDTDIKKNNEKKNNTDINNNSNTINNMFILKKKQDDKKDKKIFNVYMLPEKLRELDKACKKSGYSRNELVNIMIEHCLVNMKLED